MKVRIDNTLEITDDQRRAIAERLGKDVGVLADRATIKEWFETHGVKQGLALLEGKPDPELPTDPSGLPEGSPADENGGAPEPLSLHVNAAQAWPSYGEPTPNREALGVEPLLGWDNQFIDRVVRHLDPPQIYPASPLHPAPIAPEQMPRDGVSLHRELIDAFEQAIRWHPRTQQKIIGPSEIGTPCDRCLAHKLLQIESNRSGDWLPTVGTAVHAWADTALRKFMPRLLTECRVPVGIIANRLIDGTTDIYDPASGGTVVDLKVVGAASLKRAKAAPMEVYRKQVHLYGRGWELTGYPVADVAILYLPRNSPTLADSYWWSEPYDRGVALETLGRADALYERLHSENPSDVIPTLHREPGCYDCPRYPLMPGEAPLGVLPKTGDPFAGILPPSQPSIPPGTTDDAIAESWAPGSNPFEGILPE